MEGEELLEKVLRRLPEGAVEYVVAASREGVLLSYRASTLNGSNPSMRVVAAALSAFTSAVEVVLERLSKITGGNRDLQYIIVRTGNGAMVIAPVGKMCLGVQLTSASFLGALLWALSDLQKKL